MYSIFTFSQNKMETRNKEKRKGAGSVFTSVLPDDTKRSLLYGNVLVMSRLITLDSAMAPTAHTQLSVWNTEPDPSDEEEKTGRGLNIKEGRREGREEEEDCGTSRVEWRWNKWCDESLLWRRNWSNARTFSRHNKSRSSPEDFFRLSRECGMFCDGVKKHQTQLLCSRMICLLVGVDY